VARKCIFCEKRAGSGEHMFPDWLNKVFDQIEWQMPEGETPMWSRGAQDFRTDEVSEQVWGASEIASLILKKLCHECNTGWMADMEAVSAPLLTPMILGRPSTLNQTEQVTVGTWATKTVMVCEASMSEERNFTPEDRKIVMNENRPPGHLRVFAASLEGLITPARFGVVRMEVQNKGVRLGDLHLYTLQINMLILQVIRQDPPASVGVSMADPNFGSDGEIRVFPPIPDNPGFFWPPKKSFDLEGLPRYVTRLDNPPALPGPWGPHRDSPRNGGSPR
jgi:hypothetical protein